MKLKSGKTYIYYIVQSHLYDIIPRILALGNRRNKI